MKDKYSQYEEMSISEKQVSIFMDDNYLRWNYEQPVYVIDDKGRPRIWTPDFYLLELGLYVEVCGAERVDYDYRKKVYADNKIPIIFIHTYKRDKWRPYLIKEIERIYQKREHLLNLITNKK